MRVVRCLLFLLAVPALADGNGDWCGGGASTDWYDSGNWKYGVFSESLNRATFFRDSAQTNAAVVTASRDVMTMYVQLPSNSGVTDNSAPDPIPVTLKGPMNLTLHPRTSIALDVNAGRSLTLDGVTVPQCGGINIRGELVLRNGTSLTARPDDQYCYLDRAGARLVVDNSSFDLLALQLPGGVPAELLVKNGGFFAFQRMYGLAPVSSYLKAKVVDGTVWTAGMDTLRNVGFIPRRSGSLVVRNNGSDAFRPVLARGSHHRWGGDVYVTNRYDSALTVTNPATFYGGGRLFANYLTFPCTRATQTVDLAEINLGKELNFSGWSYLSCYDFPNGVRFGAFGDWKTSQAQDDLYYLYLHGDVVFDTLDCFDKTTPHTLWMKQMNLMPQAGLSYAGGGSVTNLINQMAPRLKCLAVGANTKAIVASAPSNVNSGDNNAVFRVQDFSLAAGARLRLPALVNVPIVHGACTVDPTARIELKLPETLENKVYPVFSTLEEDAPSGTVDLGTLPEGWQLKKNGGSWYLTNGKASYVANAVWRGGVSGKWSDGENWVVHRGPTATEPAWFRGETNLTVTNDVDDVTVTAIWAASEGGPFVLVGKPIALTAESGTVAQNSSFPFVVRTSLRSQQNVFAVSATGPAPAALLGGIAAPDAKFSVAGNVVLGGAVTARELAFAAQTFGTILTARRGADISFTAQSAAVSAKGTLWVESGATVSVAGTLDWMQENDHRIDGLLDVAGTLGSTASQGYFGTGTVAVAASAAASSAVRLGGGVTLRPASWGATPIDVVSSATLGAGGDWTYAAAGGLRVSGLGATVTFDTADHAVTVAQPLVGEDFDVVKKGTGALTFSATSALNGFVTVNAGTFVWQADQSFARLTAKPGSVLKFGSHDGTVARLNLGDSVDLTGVQLLAADADAEALAREGFCTILTVPASCEITGLPVETGDYRMKVVKTADGGRALAARIRNGLTVIIR